MGNNNEIKLNQIKKEIKQLRLELNQLKVDMQDKLAQIEQLQQDLATAEQTKEQEITNILDAIELALREEI